MRGGDRLGWPRKGWPSLFSDRSAAWGTEHGSCVQSPRRSIGSKPRRFHFGKYFEQHSFWVYSYSDCVLKTTVKKVSVEKLFLDEGWNLLSIPKTFSGKTFVDIQNSCDVLSAYAWKSDKQQWYAFEDQQEMQDNGQGIIVKVDKSCIMQ